MFVIAATLGLAIQLREREIALLRRDRGDAAAGAPDAALGGDRAGARAPPPPATCPGVALAHRLIDAFAARGLAPEGMAVDGGVIPALVDACSPRVPARWLAAWAGARRAARVAPTRALQESAVEPRMIGAVRLLAGLVALAGGGARRSASRSARATRTPRSRAADGVALVLGGRGGAARPARGAASPRSCRAPRRAALAGRRLPRHRRHPQRAAARRVGDDAARARRSRWAARCCSRARRRTPRRPRSRATAQVADLVVSATAGVPEAAVREVRATPGVGAATGISPTGIVPLDDAAPRLRLRLARGAGDRRRRARRRRSTSACAPGRSPTCAATRSRSAHGAREAGHVRVGRPRRGRARRRHAGAPAGGGDATTARSASASSCCRARSSRQHTHAAARRRGARAARRRAPRARAWSRAARDVAAAHPGLHVGGRAALKSDEARERRMLVWLNRVLAGLIFAFTAIAAVNTLAMIAALPRARARAAAAGRRHAAAGRADGALGDRPRGAGRHRARRGGRRRRRWLPVQPRAHRARSAPDGRLRAGSPALLGGTAALGLVASLLPTRLALRASPADAIGHQGVARTRWWSTCA